VNQTQQEPFGGFSELHELLQASLLGALASDQHDRLEYLVCEHPAARRMYVSYLAESIGLRRWATPPAIAAARPKYRDLLLGFGEQFWLSARSFCTRVNLLWLGVGIVASFVEVAVILALLAPSDPQTPAELAVQPAHVPNPQKAIGVPTRNEQPPVAKLLGESNARWADTLKLDPGASLFAKTQYELLSGMVEIEFNSGSRVILQGPASWTPTGPMGNRLHLGRLTARVPKQAHGFTVETNLGSIVDLGTEFAVEVSSQGDSFVHVFEGSVQAVHHTAGDQLPAADPAASQILTEGQSTNLGSEMSIESETPVEQVARFTRWMPAPGRFPLFATGRGMAEGATDPHWSVAHESDPNHWQMATVAKPNAQWRANDRYWSQWISPAADGNANQAPGRYTFRTEFDLTGFDHRAAQIIGHWMADNSIEQISINGTPLLTAPQSHNFQEFTYLLIKQGFVPGSNVIDFVVVNDSGDPNPFGFRLDWHGVALPADWNQAAETSSASKSSQAAEVRQ
jgi:hypothetical protein